MTAAGVDGRTSALRIAVVGKGGAGKSVIAGTMTRLFARRGHRVLALDSDLMPGLAYSLGADAPAEPPLLDAAEKDEDGRWRLKKGIGPVRAVRRYSTTAPDGVLLLQAGKPPAEGVQPIMGSLNAFYKVVHRLGGASAFRDWYFVGDLPAGPRQAAFDWAPYAEVFVLVVEPTWKSALTGRRVARIARSRREATVLPVANKVREQADTDRVEEILGEPVLASIPVDEAVAEADRLGVPLIESAAESPALSAIEAMVDDLERTGQRPPAPL